MTAYTANWFKAIFMFHLLLAMCCCCCLVSVFFVGPTSVVVLDSVFSPRPILSFMCCSYFYFICSVDPFYALRFTINGLYQLSLTVDEWSFGFGDGGCLLAAAQRNCLGHETPGSLHSGKSLRAECSIGRQWTPRIGQFSITTIAAASITVIALPSNTSFSVRAICYDGRTFSE